MAISNTTTVPVLIAARLLDVYRKNLVFGNLVSRDYESALRSGPGDRIRINTAATQSVADYTAGATLTYAAADVATPMDLVLNKAKSWAVQIDDMSAVQSTPSLLDAAVAEAGVALAAAVDADLLAAFLADATADPTGITFDPSKVGDMITWLSALHRVLTIHNVPQAGRFLVIGPHMAENLQVWALSANIVASPAVAGLIGGGVGNFAGFDIHIAPQFTTSTPSGGKYNVTENVFIGNRNAVQYAEQIRRVENIRLQTTFADAVRGLLTYGYKTVKPDALFKTTATITGLAET